MGTKTFEYQDYLPEIEAAIMLSAVEYRVRRGSVPSPHGTARREARGATEVTVEALMYSLRSRGAAALTEPDTQRRLSELSPDQLKEVIERLERLRPKYSAITDNLLLGIAQVLP